MATKNCFNPKCKQKNPQPLAAFGKYKRAPDGLKPRCKACRSAYTKKFYNANRKRILEKIYAYNQTEEAKKKRRIRENARVRTPWQKLKNKLSCRLNSFAIRKNDSHDNQELFGCTYAKIRGHIEKQFKDGMSWDNYGDVWEFDHIIPYKAFTTVEELEKNHKIVCWYKNVRPLLVTENRRDGADYDEDAKQALIRRFQLWEIEREVLALI